MLVFTVNKLDVNSNNMLNLINLDFERQKNEIDNLIEIEKTKLIDQNEINKLQNKADNLSILKNNQIQQISKSYNKKKFDNVKIIIRNIILGSIWTLAFYKFFIL